MSSQPNPELRRADVPAILNPIFLAFYFPGLLVCVVVAWTRTLGSWTGLNVSATGLGHSDPAFLLLGAVAYFLMIVWLLAVLAWARPLKRIPTWTRVAVIAGMLGLIVSSGPVSVVEAPFVFAFGQGKGAKQFLPTAAHEQSRMLVRAIVARGDINAHDGSLHSLLGWAAGGEVDFVTWLLDQGANPNARGNLGQTPLMTAIGNWNVPVIRVLLARGADARASTPGGESVLDLAIDTKDEEIIELVRAASR